MLLRFVSSCHVFTSIATAFIGLFVFVSSVPAQMTTYRFSGWLPPGSSSHSQVADGETFLAIFVVDRSVPDTDPSIARGVYPGCIVSGSLRFSGGYVSPLDFTSSSEVSVHNGDTTPSGYEFDSVAVRRPGFEINQVSGDYDSIGSDSLPRPGDFFTSGELFGTTITPQISYSDSNGTITFDDRVGRPNVVFFAHGNDNSWIDTAGGYFEVGANWRDLTAPTISETASFDSSGLYSVDWDSITGNVVNRRFTVVDAGVTFRSVDSSIGNPVYEYSTSQSAFVYNSLLDIGDGTDQHYVSIGSSMWVDGSTVRVLDGSHLEVTSGLRLGLTPTVTSSFFVLGGSADIGFLEVGVWGDGICGANGGATVNCFSMHIGDDQRRSNSGLVGQLGISDFGTVWTVTAGTYVGDGNGQGLISISNGAVLNGERAVIGWSPGSGSVTIQNPGSQWNLDTELLVGVHGIGNLSVKDNAQVSCQDCAVGNVVGSVSELIADNALISISRDLDVGERGPAELRLSEDAQVIADNIYNHAQGSILAGGTNGSVLTTSGLLTNDGLIHVTCPEPDFNGSVVNNGTIISSAGAESWFLQNLWHDGTEIRTESSSLTRVFGTFIGSSPFTGLGPVQFDGGIAPSGGPTRGTTVPFEGHVNLMPSTFFACELAGTGSGQFDRLIVDGDVQLDGVLAIDPISPYFPDVDDEFLIIEVGGTQSGQFIGLNEGDDIGIGLHISYVGGDGNDVALIAPKSAVPDALNVTRGNLASGTAPDLGTSNQQDVSILRNSTDVQSITQFDVTLTSPFAAPSQIIVQFEGSVFARSQVIQTLELFNVATNDWETIDSRPAQQFVDMALELLVEGELARFVDGAGTVRARATYRSDNPRQAFSSNTDVLRLIVSP